MKKILVVMHWLEIGGAETSLIWLLRNIDYKKYSVDLHLYRHTGELMNLIPSEVNVLQEDKNCSAIAMPISEVLKQKRFGIFFSRLLAKLYIAFSSNKLDDLSKIQIIHRFATTFLKPMKNEYDLAISFLAPHYFVKSKVKSKRKAAWIHTDYSIDSICVNKAIEMWLGYDNIVSISDQCSEAFLKIYPTLEKNIIKIENILSAEYIREEANKSDINIEAFESDKSIKLLSIGRYSYPKNFDNVPEICKRVRDMGIDVKWYIIGYGTDEELIRKKISENNMEQYVILLGKKSNPYPYIKRCDLYVQPSRYEGKSVTVREAQILCKPVIITNYKTSDSQLINGHDGIIVPLDNEGCAKGIADLIQNKKLQKELSENCCYSDYSNKSEVEKIYRMGD